MILRTFVQTRVLKIKSFYVFKTNRASNTMTYLLRKLKRSLPQFRILSIGIRINAPENCYNYKEKRARITSLIVVNYNGSACLESSKTRECGGRCVNFVSLDTKGT